MSEGVILPSDTIMKCLEYSMEVERVRYVIKNYYTRAGSTLYNIYSKRKTFLEKAVVELVYK